MKNIFIVILVLVSVQSFGQLRLYAERKNTDNTTDSFYVKFILDSVFNKQGDYVCPTVESFAGQFEPAYPQGFANFTKCPDGIYRNILPFAQNAGKVRWDSILNKPATFTPSSHTHTVSELSNASTVGGNLLAMSNPASASLIRVNSNGTAVTRTAAEAKQDLSLDQVDNTSDANKPISSATQTALNAKASLTGSEAITNKTLGAFNVGLDAGANDNYSVTLSPAPAAYTTGMIVIFRANTANTTGCSINVNGLGSVNIVKRVSTTLATGDILAQMFCMLVYNGSAFVILNPVVN